MRIKRLLLYLAAAAVLLAAAGCGEFVTGATFTGEFDLEKNDAVTAVQKWFKSMEFEKVENEKGELVVDREAGRDFWLYLEVVEPQFLLDQAGQFIGPEQLLVVRDRWNDPAWEVEFKEVQIQLVGEEEANREQGEATVEIVGGIIRYIGEFFGTSELKQDNYGEKKGEIHLRWIPPDPKGDVLVQLAQLQEVPQEYRDRYRRLAEEGRWVITGGLDRSEESAWEAGSP